jgi:hypothetical protein
VEEHELLLSGSWQSSKSSPQKWSYEIRTFGPLRRFVDAFTLASDYISISGHVEKSLGLIRTAVGTLIAMSPYRDPESPVP